MQHMILIPVMHTSYYFTSITKELPLTDLEQLPTPDKRALQRNRTCFM